VDLVDTTGSRYILRSVAVGSDKWKPVTHAFAPDHSGVPTEGSSNRLFCFLQDCFFELKRDLVARLHVGVHRFFSGYLFE